MTVSELINSMFAGRKYFPPIKPYFIREDEFSGVEQICNRAAIAAFYLRGNGIEIGALHKPLKVDDTKASVKYVDYKSLEENRKRYPELADEAIVHTDIIDDGFVLSEIKDNSVDFIIANHALEHSPDPLGTLTVWHNRIKPGGVIYVTVPMAELCYDKGRAITTIDHMYNDQLDFQSINKRRILKKTQEHILDFITISGNNIRTMNSLGPITEEEKSKLTRSLMKGLKEEMGKVNTYAGLMYAHISKINRVYDIHYHTFSPYSYEYLLTAFCRNTNARLENVIKNGNGECIGIIRKKENE